MRARFLTLREPYDIIISGGCPTGADRFAEVLALEIVTAVGTLEAPWALDTLYFLKRNVRREMLREWHAPIVILDAQWQRGRGAGYDRNTHIAMNSDVLLACVAPDRTGGTEDIVKKFVDAYGEKYLHLVE